VFCTEDENAPEIFTDDATFRRYCRRIIGWEIVAIALWVLLIYNSIRSIPVITDGPGGRYFNMSLWSPAEYVLIIVQIILVVIILARIIIRGLLMVKRVREGRTAKSAAGEPGWKRAWRSGIISYILCLVLIVCCAVSIRSLWVTDAEIADPVNYDGTELLLYRNFDPESWDRVKETLEAGNTGADGNEIYDYRIQKDNSFIMKSAISEILQPMFTTDGNEGVTYQENLYEAKSEEKAEGYLADELAYMYNWPDDISGDGQKVMKDIEFDCEGVDYAGYYVQTRSYESVYGEDDGSHEDLEYQNLYLRKGAKIISVLYSGDIDLRSKVSLYTAKLAD